MKSDSFYRDNPKQFEELCADYYGRRYQEPHSVLFGRNGQKQYGIDILLQTKRIAIQCKAKDLTETDIRQDLAKLDESELELITIVFATVRERDSALQLTVHALSNERERAGKCAVVVDFYEDIERELHIHPDLVDKYDPASQGAMLHRMEGMFKQLIQQGAMGSASIGVMPLLPALSAAVRAQLEQAREA